MTTPIPVTICAGSGVNMNTGRKLLKAPDPGALEFVLMRLMMPKNWCVYYDASGNVLEEHQGEMELREMVVFIRRDEKIPCKNGLT